jgi:probable F420-dependent oxidoreductase
MRFAVSLPTDRIAQAPEFVTQDAVAEVARTAEACGFGACYVTDHPFPPHKWLHGGGHHALDPFVALSFAAAATTTLRVQTHIMVVPYRNPFLAAKAILSLDVLSGGRVTVGVAAGYLKGEFAALGADFEARNDVTDEYLRAMTAAWAGDDVRFEGRGYAARGNSTGFRPVQRPRPPIWVGGNSRTAIRRAVALGDGWVPFPNTAAMAPFTRTPVLETVDDLAQRLAFARAYAAEIGRTAPLDVCTTLPPSLGGATGATRDDVAALEALGVTWLTVSFPAETRRDYLAAMERFARDLITA